MTVAELIEQLKTMPQDAVVVHKTFSYGEFYENPIETAFLKYTDEYGNAISKPDVMLE